MSMALQIAQFLASVAVVAFVVFLIPVLIGLREHAARALRELEELKSDVRLLVQDSRSMVQNVNNLTSRAQLQMDEVDKLLRLVRGWSERTDRVVNEVGVLVEGQLLTATRLVKLVHLGLGRLLESLATKYDINRDSPRNAGKKRIRDGKHS